MAAPKIASGMLRAIFIECSFSDSIDDGYLYGHLCPRHLIAELEVLAGKVLDAQKPHAAGASRKRKRQSSPSTHQRAESISPRSVRPSVSQGHENRPTSSSSASRRSGKRASSLQQSGGNVSESFGKNQKTTSDETTGEHGADEHGNVMSPPDNNLGHGPLRGLRVYIIHIKESLADGPHPREKILEELRKQGADAGLGCQFFAPRSGEAALV